MVNGKFRTIHGHATSIYSVYCMLIEYDKPDDVDVIGPDSLPMEVYKFIHMVKQYS
jgi:hypothetical protein